MRTPQTLLLCIFLYLTLSETRSLDITNFGLEDDRSFIGLQNALGISFGNSNQTATLDPSACMQSDGTQNCTAACMNAAQMFSSLRTLHNCVMYPIVSAYRANNSLSTRALQLAKDLRIGSTNTLSTPSSNILNAIQRCMLDSCRDNDDCRSAVNRLSKFSGTGYANPCSKTPAYINADVGGIGVFISYVMQMSFVLLAAIVIIPWPIIRRTIYGFITARRSAARSPERQSSVAKRWLKGFFVKSERREYPGALMTALVAFQKAQCFFMLSTNIAGIVVQKAGGSEPESLQQLFNTYVFIKFIAIGGYLPITFTLLTLHIISKLSWYILGLSAVSIAVAASTQMIQGSAFQPSEEDLSAITGAASQGGPSSCASQNLAWCYNPLKNKNHFAFYSSDSGYGANEILAFCLVTFFLLVIGHFCRSDDTTQQGINLKILTKLHITTNKPLFPHAGTVLRVGTHVFHFVFFWIYVYCFYVFGEVFNWFVENHIYSPVWGFGQIVAVLIWVPVLCDYLQDQTRGIRKGFEHRLPQKYEVIKRETSSYERSDSVNLSEQNTAGFTKR